MFCFQSRKCEDTQRCLLPASRAFVRARLAGVVLHDAAAARGAREDAAPGQDGQGDQRGAPDQLSAKLRYLRFMD